MQLIVNIDKEVYKAIKNSLDSGGYYYSKCYDAIWNGIPLPKEYGRLIDADAFIAMMEDASKRQKYKELLIDDCLTVDDVFKAIIESLQNKGLAIGDALTVIEAESEK